MYTNPSLVSKSTINITARLKKSRGYSDEKIDNIMESQSSDDTFRKYCRVVIDNSKSLEDTKDQLKQYL